MAKGPARTDRDDPSARFRRLAENRVRRTIRDLRLIGNLSNRSNYAYTPEEVDKIFRTLERELRLTKARFEGSRGDDDVDFTL